MLTRLLWTAYVIAGIAVALQQHVLPGAPSAHSLGSAVLVTMLWPLRLLGHSLPTI